VIEAQLARVGRADLRAVAPASFGAARLYFTGSKAHNIALRARAQDAGLKLNEYGVFRGDQRIAGRIEASVYQALGLPFIEPELREDRGEIAAAQAGRLPRLVQLSDLRGDLHAITALFRPAATSRSRSPTVSRPRRRLPAGSACCTPGTCRSSDSSESATCAAMFSLTRRCD
jgi:hypothetical protein